MVRIKARRKKLFLADVWKRVEKHVEVVVVVAVVIVVVVVDRGKIARLDCFYFFFQQLLKIVVVVCL